MIHLIIGKQGSGKTLFLVKKAYECYKLGKTVYSNVALNFPYKQLDYQDIIDCKLEKGIVILDEVHQLLPSRLSMSKQNRVICDGFLSMVRKKGLQIFGTTQTERKVDIRFQEEKDYFYNATRYAYISNRWIEITNPDMDFNESIPIMINLDVQDTGSGNVIKMPFHANPYFKLYDTNQIIRVKGLKV